MEELMLKIENVSKQYKLGQIGGTTLYHELQRLRAKRKGLADPTKKIGAKDYNKGELFMALDGVSFEVKKGERVGIIGHNGAGKSTLLKLISRITAPTGGTISLNGRIASMLEVGTGFHPELTGRENVYMNGAILGMTKKEIDAKIEDIIDFSECREFIDTPVRRYSSGMYVKLAFSVAAHLDSEIMIMDEVLAVGDMAFQKKCLDKMNDVSREQGRTILYVSHNMNTIRQLCDRVIVLDHGKVVFDGGVEEGIGVYMGKSNVYSSDIDLSMKERANVHHPYARIQRFSLIEKDDVFFDGKEPMRFKLSILAQEDFEDAYLRMIVVCPNGSKAGMAMSDTPISAKKGENITACFEQDISFLVSGKYTLHMFLSGINSIGEIDNYDAILDAFSFEVINQQVKSIWYPASWGYVSLPKTKTIENE